ncbi:hypothetical protein IFO66_18375 [Paenibacillus sp. CAU 1523]|uniref:Uncharacterized protein n=1 Tax=Paenibacillus arenosi TaxID=2774142 RepID=A0ABR9B1K8_9BACL|nr:hypothetical protein [Paenibacillus arenosi]
MLIRRSIYAMEAEQSSGLTPDMQMHIDWFPRSLIKGLSDEQSPKLSDCISIITYTRTIRGYDHHKLVQAG